MASWLENAGRRIKEGREKVSAGAASTGGSYSSGSQQRQAAEPSIGQTWELPDLNTTRGLLARFYQMGSTDPTRAQEGLTMFEQLRMDPSSVYFNPYASHTNRALDNLRELGMEVDEVNDDWFAANAGLKQYYKPTANTNSLSSTMTNRRASPEEKAAYYYNQLWMAEGTTKKAEQEWSALQKELTYRASQADRNYSDDEIIGMIDWKKYPTLAKMDETRKQGTPMELNRAIGYSQDALYGTLWAARNEGGTGNPYQDMINSALGVGNVYTADETIRAKRTYSSEFYSPFSLGSTMDKEREHFGVDSFDQHWVDNHAYLMDTGSDKDKEYYINVVEALDETNTAMGEYDRLKAAVDRSIETAKTPEEAKERLHLLLDSGEFPKLKKMDATMKRGNDKLMKTTSAIPYSMGDMERYIDEQWGTVRANTQDEIGYAEELERQVSGPEIVISQDTEDHEVDAVTGADIPVNTPAPVKPTEESGSQSRFEGSNGTQIVGNTGRGNIDLYNRPVVKNPDGTISTVNSFSIEVDGKTVLLPEQARKVLSLPVAQKQHDFTDFLLCVFQEPGGLFHFAPRNVRRQILPRRLFIVAGKVGRVQINIASQVFQGEIRADILLNIRLDTLYDFILTFFPACLIRTVFDYPQNCFLKILPDDRLKQILRNPIANSLLGILKLSVARQENDLHRKIVFGNISAQVHTADLRHADIRNQKTGRFILQHISGQRTAPAEGSLVKTEFFPVNQFFHIVQHIDFVIYDKYPHIRPFLLPPFHP